MGQIQMARVEDFLRQLSIRMKTVEKLKANLSEEGFSDLVLATFERAARTRSATKRGKFAQILKRQALEGADWEEAETAVRLLGDLEDIHIAILGVALNAPRVGAPWDGSRVVCLTDRGKFKTNVQGIEPIFLNESLPRLSMLSLRMATADLLSRGLLHDQAVDAWGGVSMEFFAPTHVADWFAMWTQDSLNHRLRAQTGRPSSNPTRAGGGWRFKGYLPSDPGQPDPAATPG
jgi:hypothetical protein